MDGVDDAYVEWTGIIDSHGVLTGSMEAELNYSGYAVTYTQEFEAVAQ